MIKEFFKFSTLVFLASINPLALASSNYTTFEKDNLPPELNEVKEAISQKSYVFWKEILENQLSNSLSQNSSTLNALNLENKGYSVLINSNIARTFASEERSFYNVNQVALFYKEGETKYSMQFNKTSSSWFSNHKDNKDRTTSLGFSIGYGNTLYKDFSYQTSFSYNNYQGQYKYHLKTPSKEYRFDPDFSLEDLALSGYVFYNFNTNGEKLKLVLKPGIGFGFSNTKLSAIHSESSNPNFQFLIPHSAGNSFLAKFIISSRVEDFYFEGLDIGADYLLNFDLRQWNQLPSYITQGNKEAKLNFKVKNHRLLQQGRFIIEYKFSYLKLALYSEFIKEEVYTPTVGIRIKVNFDNNKPFQP